MITVGHRGASGHVPGNTVASFKKALELGVDMVELDAYRCKTGEIVIFHDRFVDKLTNGTGLIEEKSFEEIKKLKVSGEHNIPTLQEVLDVIDRKAKVNIELKNKGTAEPVAEIIEQYVKEKGWKYSDFMVSSFDHYELRKFHELLTKVPLGAITSGIPIGYNSFAQMLRADVVVLSFDTINKEMVDDAHERELKVYVYTVNEPYDIAYVKELGVDGIVSDYPERV